MNELFSFAGLASQVLFCWVCTNNFTCRSKYMSQKKVCHRAKDYLSLVRFSIRIDVLALTFAKSLSGIVEASCMLWLYGKGFIKRAACFGSCRHTSQK